VTKQQAAFIIVVNAFVSLVISLVVVLLVHYLVIPLSLPAAPPPTAESAGPPTSTRQAGTKPAPTPLIYTVQPGDTLLGIAARFDVSAGDLMRANGLTNADLLQVGQTLVIPAGAPSAGTATFTPVPTPTETPLPFEPPTLLPMKAAPPAEPAATTAPTVTPTPLPPTALPVAVRVSEVVAAGDYVNEAVIILNHGRSVRLDGWTLSSQDGRQYTFPSLFLGSGGGVRIHTIAGQDTSTDLHWGQQSAVWNSPGDIITLRDSAGRVMDSYKLP
jgi:LysM repeat protein